MNTSLRRVWEQVSLYLPVLLMALLALGTWWLVRNAPKPLQGAAQPVASTTPDYSMQDFSVRQFDASGRLHSEMVGTAARHYPHNDFLEVDDVRTRNVAVNGLVTSTSAQRGISNGDASEVQLWGNAQVRRQPADGSAALQIDSEFLHAWPNEERVKSHVPVVITKGGDRLAGDNLDYDNLSQVLELKGRVSTVLQPRSQ